MNWKVLSFENCLEKVKSPKKLNKKKYLNKGKFPVVAQENTIINGYTNDESLVFKIKNPVIIFGDHTRKLKYIDFDFVLGADGVKIIKPKSDINVKFFYYYLTHMLPKSIGYARHYKLLKKIKFNVPPLSEQQRIVAKLDTAFVEIDKSIQASEKKIENINLLYEQFLDIKLDKLKTKDNLLVKDFCYTSDFVANGSFASLAANVKYLDNEDYAILVRLTDYRKNFKSKLKYVSKKSYDYLKHSKLKEGDLILTNVGAYSGTPFLIPKLKKPSTLGPNAILIRADNKIIYNEYLKYFFESNKGIFALESITTGTTHKKFNKTSLRKLKIKIPSLKEQTEYISKIREFNKEVSNFKVKEKLIIKNYLSLKKIMFKNAVNQNKLVA